MKDDEEGSVKILASDEALAGLGERLTTGAKGDPTITQVEATGLRRGILLSWEAKSIGFGQLMIAVDDDGVVDMDTEAMGPEFVKSVLGKLVDDWFAKDAERES